MTIIDSSLHDSSENNRSPERLKRKRELCDLEPRIALGLNFLDSIRSSSGGYPARNPGDEPSVATTAIVCIAKKKAGAIGKALDPKTQEDVNFLLGRFDRTSQSWKIFRDISSTWSTSLCILALSILGCGNEPCVKSAVDRLVSIQSSGGWGVTSQSDNELLITYFATISLIKYYSNANKDHKIKGALKMSAEYFIRCLDDRIDDLNVTDCALALQALDDINSLNIINRFKLAPWRNKALDRIHNLISNKKYVEQTRIIYKVGSGEWHICHFHPAILPIIYRHKCDDLDIYELLNWFTTNFEIEGEVGKWKHFTNGDSTYTTALAVYALCDLFNGISIMDFVKIMHKKIQELDEKNQKLQDDFNYRVKQFILDNKTVASISNYAGAASPVIWLLGLVMLIAGIIWRDILERYIMWIVNKLFLP